MPRLLATAALVLSAQLAAAGIAGPPLSTLAKALQADAVVVGKVTGVESEAMEVLPYATAPAKVKVNVVTIKIETSLLGAKNLTHVKVLVESNPPQPRPGRDGAVTLTDGQDGLFILSQFPAADGYFAVHSPPVGPTARTFDADLKAVKRVAAAVTDPLKAVTEGEPNDRLAAACLVAEWHRVRPAGPKSEEVAIPAAQTKAILKALADGEWTAAGTLGDDRLTPLTLLSNLGLTPGTPKGLPAINPKPGEDYNALAREAFRGWLAKHGDKFVIKTRVPKAK